MPVRQSQAAAPQTASRSLPGSSARLDEIPGIAIQILENGDQAVGLLIGLANKSDALRFQRFVIARQIIRIQEEKYPTAGLVADALTLLVIHGAREKKAGSSRSARPDNDPALVLFGEVSVF